MNVLVINRSPAHHTPHRFNQTEVTHMLRTIMVSVLIGGAATGCASLGSGTTAGNYCLTDDSGRCSPIEGASDCQPCPKSADNTRSLAANYPADRNQIP
jgi:hypothetical protein